MPSRWLGIDFSGNDRIWRCGCTTSNVWLAEVHGGAGRLFLRALSRVQHRTTGSAPPFDWLCSALSEGRFVATAVDAPFSVPAQFVGSEGHAGLVARIGRRTPPHGHPFLPGADFVKSVTGLDPPVLPKPYRATEQHWRDRKVETRSTLWVKPRGGAPMTAACIRLLHLARRPVWPWVPDGTGLLVEGFPAAQLCQWRLPHEEYNGTKSSTTDVRYRIIQAFKDRLELPADFERQMAGSADALDAVVFAFAAIAVTTGQVAHSPGPEAQAEGWIAVCR